MHSLHVSICSAAQLTNKYHIVKEKKSVLVLQGHLIKEEDLTRKQIAGELHYLESTSSGALYLSTEQGQHKHSIAGFPCAALTRGGTFV